MTALRHKEDNAFRKHDYVTMEQCVAIATAVADVAILTHEEKRRARQWHRRLLAWWRAA